MLKKIAAVLIFAVFLFIALKFYNYMSRDGFNDAGPITGFMCPDGWQQMPIDDSNGTCVAPCTPGNNNPQSFAYGPNAGGFPLNRRSGYDYCVDTNNGSDQSQAFSVRSATVGGPPIVAAPASMPFTCPDGWSQTPIDSMNGSCTAPCTPGNNNPQSFSYGPNAGGYPLNRRSGSDYCTDTYNGSDQSQAFSVRSATVGGPPIVAAPASAQASFPDFDNSKTYGVNDIVKAGDQLYIMTVGIGASGYYPAAYPQHWAVYTPPMAAPPVAEPVQFTCPDGWNQTPTDSMNGTCNAPCTTGNNNPQSFSYGPNAGGYPLNRRSGSDYCTDTYNGSDQSQAFSVRSATVGGPPIAIPMAAEPLPGAVVQAPVSISAPAPVSAPTTMIPQAPISYICPNGFSQVANTPTSGTCTAPCFPGKGSPRSFSYGPSSGGYPVSRRTGQSYCTKSKFINMRAEYSKRTPTVQLTTVNEGFKSMRTVDHIQLSCPGLSPKAVTAAAEVEASRVEDTIKIKDMAAKAAEVVADKIRTETIPGLNITCPSGEKPKISYIRNSKFGTPSKDINTLKGVRGYKPEFSCSEPRGNQYIFNPFTDN